MLRWLVHVAALMRSSAAINICYFPEEEGRKRFLYLSLCVSHILIPPLAQDIFCYKLGKLRESARTHCRILNFAQRKSPLKTSIALLCIARHDLHRVVVALDYYNTESTILPKKFLTKVSYRVLDSVMPNFPKYFDIFTSHLRTVKKILRELEFLLRVSVPSVQMP